MDKRHLSLDGRRRKRALLEHGCRRRRRGRRGARAGSLGGTRGPDGRHDGRRGGPDRGPWGLGHLLGRGRAAAQRRRARSARHRAAPSRDRRASRAPRPGARPAREGQRRARRGGRPDRRARGHRPALRRGAHPRHRARAARTAREAGAQRRRQAPRGGDRAPRRDAAVVDRPSLSASPRRRPSRATSLLATALFVVACRARAVAPDVSPGAHLHVLMVNGGGSKAQNYQSHFLHLRRLLELLARAGVPSDHITVFSADGPAPEADMAVREIEPEANFRLLRGTRLAAALGTQIVYANSEIPGVPLRAATRAGLTSWFKQTRRRLRPGEPLLLYVTDHGTRDEKDTGDNRIVLWGEKESISVGELRELVAKLDPGVRVVALMSQCFSGAFANLMSVHAREGQPGGAVCGYFSSTPDRPAYGCYPENRGKDNVGHSFHFFQALDSSPALPQAHLDVLATDRTPDVPIRTSQVYLERLLERAARDAGEERAALVDALLREAWRDKAAWEPEIRLLDRIAHAFGVFSPRSLAELDQQAKSLPDLAEQLRKNGGLWQATLDDLDDANLGRFLAAHPDWVPRIDDASLAVLGPEGRRGLAGALLAELAPFTRTDGATDARLPVLGDKGESASAPASRLEVRLAALPRAAGLRVADVILGPPGKPFTEPRQVREWTMLSAVDRPAPLLVQRGDRHVRVTLVPKPYPIRLPELPGPPQVGSAAPPLKVAAYRGTLPDRLGGGKRRLLFFWATWCGPCKASLPELLAFEQERDVQVIAITDEPAEQLDPFFEKFTSPFPATVAVDEPRSAFQAYGVSGTPTFVLVDEDGKVASASTGYTPEKGLGIEGWSWSKRAAR